jgi:peptidoglycan L-alanyl-D-glutamate endopeptidase CwlK
MLMTNTAKRCQFLQHLALLIQKATLEGIEFIVWTFYRSPADQNFLYQQGRTRPGKIITNCDGTLVRSRHQDWLAVDILIIKDGADQWIRTPEYDRLGEIWESLGGKWGGNFKSPAGDIFHFQAEVE